LAAAAIVPLASNTAAASRSKGLSGGESGLPPLAIVADQTSEQACDVAGARIDSRGAEVDDAGDLVAGKQDVIVPNVAEAPLEREGLRRPARQLFAHAWSHGFEVGNDCDCQISVDGGHVCEMNLVKLAELCAKRFEAGNSSKHRRRDGNAGLRFAVGRRERGGGGMQVSEHLARGGELGGPTIVPKVGFAGEPARHGPGRYGAVGVESCVHPTAVAQRDGRRDREASSCEVALELGEQFDPPGRTGRGGPLAKDIVSGVVRDPPQFSATESAGGLKRSNSAARGALEPLADKHQDVGGRRGAHDLAMRGAWTCQLGSEEASDRGAGASAAVPCSQRWGEYALNPDAAVIWSACESS
jgi:hypothetical protein